MNIRLKQEFVRSTSSTPKAVIIPSQFIRKKSGAKQLWHSHLKRGTSNKEEENSNPELCVSVRRVEETCSFSLPPTPARVPMMRRGKFARDGETGHRCEVQSSCHLQLLGCRVENHEHDRRGEILRH